MRAHCHPSVVLAVGPRRWLRVLSLGILAVYGLFFILFWNRSGPRDGDQFLVFHTLQYWNASMFGIAKQWTPLMCSGLSMAGEPQIPFMSLSMALTYVVGPLWGVKSAIVIYMAIGWLGAYLYAGPWLRVKPQRTLAAALFIGNGFFFCRLAFGHFDFVPFLILPLVLWVLHRGMEWQLNVSSFRKSIQTIATALLVGALLALAIDGSPVAIIHLLFWMALYALILAWTVRSLSPLVLIVLAATVAAVLDAGYLWPMIASQSAFPRSTPDRFTSVLSLLWFAILPARGKVLPANGNGHELSVFIGPILGYCLWRYRHWLALSLPTSMRHPLLIVSLVSILLGMGSLKALHIPIWLSPFDLLRPLPGFRSLGVTGRYWGFLALPLSLLAAGALFRFASERPEGWRVHACLGVAVVLQLGFQAETLTSLWLHSPNYHIASIGGQFQSDAENIEYVALDDRQLQGQLIEPTRGVSNCYDMDDFNRAQSPPGNTLITRVIRDQTPADPLPRLSAQFATWSRIHLQVDCATPGERSSCRNLTGRIQTIFREAYHPGWQAAGCDTRADAQGHLTMDCPASRMRTGAIALTFDDHTSDIAAHVSTMSWQIWLWTTGPALILWLSMTSRVCRMKAFERTPECISRSGY
jgi:hypothetical protein